MARCILWLQILAMPRPPQILQIHREPVKRGSEAAYQRLERDTARLCAALGCPHPYLGIESLTGRKEVWFFNGYRSSAEKKQVYDDYARNAALMAALKKNSARKARLTGKPISVFTSLRQDLGHGAPWILGQGRFLVITVTKEDPQVEGTVFEAPGGTQYIVTATRTRREADAAAVRAGSASRVFAVRPDWSFAANEWVAADPVFWRSDFQSK